VKPIVFDPFKKYIYIYICFIEPNFLLLFTPASLKRTCPTSYVLISVSIPTEYFYAFLISPFVPFRVSLILINNNNNNNFSISFNFLLLSLECTALKHHQPNLYGSHSVVFIYPQTLFVSLRLKVDFV